MEQTRRYPIGVQTFEKIREGGFLYIDKTALVYDLVTSNGDFEHYLFPWKTAPVREESPGDHARSVFLRKEGTVPGTGDGVSGEGLDGVSCAPLRLQRDEVLQY